METRGKQRRGGVEVWAFRRGMLGRARSVIVGAALLIGALLVATWWMFGQTDALADSTTSAAVDEELCRIQAEVSSVGAEDASEDASDTLPTAVQLDVPSLFQYPELPTGCESVALTDALLFCGFTLSTTEIADRWLPTSDTDFVEAFMGSPRSIDGHACMAPCIAQTAAAYLEAQESHLVASDATGMEFEELLTTVAQGTPVVAWCTIDLEPTYDSYAESEYDGITYHLFANSHCVVVSGYDVEAGLVYVSDPLAGRVSYDMALFAARYYELGAQAVVIA